MTTCDCWCPRDGTGCACPCPAHTVPLEPFEVRGHITDLLHAEMNRLSADEALDIYFREDR